MWAVLLGMVWSMDPEGELAELIEWGAIFMVVGTCVVALYVEHRVYRQRHGLEHRGKQEKD
jgi:hypothetical protein